MSRLERFPKALTARQPGLKILKAWLPISVLPLIKRAPIGARDVYYDSLDLKQQYIKMEVTAVRGVNGHDAYEVGYRER